VMALVLSVSAFAVQSSQDVQEADSATVTNLPNGGHLYSFNGFTYEVSKGTVLHAVSASTMVPGAGKPTYYSLTGATLTRVDGSSPSIFLGNAWLSLEQGGPVIESDCAVIGARGRLVRAQGTGMTYLQPMDLGDGGGEITVSCSNGSLVVNGQNTGQHSMCMGGMLVTCDGDRVRVVSSSPSCA
jgi:hypothetical protein